MAELCYGSESCSLFTKTGACYYGNRCPRIHTRPTISHALVLLNMYQRPDFVDPTLLQEHFEDFYEDVYEELSCFGEIESLSVCDDLVEHLIGNVYVVFKETHQAAAALHAFRTRAYCGRDIVVEFLGVRTVGLVKCWKNMCSPGSGCKYMHEMLIGRGLWKKLFGKCRLYDSGRGMREYGSSVCARSPVREMSEEGRTRIKMWNREREGRVERRPRTRERGGSEERRARIEMWNREREEWR